MCSCFFSAWDIYVGSFEPREIKNLSFSKHETWWQDANMEYLMLEDHP